MISYNKWLVEWNESNKGYGWFDCPDLRSFHVAQDLWFIHLEQLKQSEDRYLRRRETQKSWESLALKFKNQNKLLKERLEKLEGNKAEWGLVRPIDLLNEKMKELELNKKE